MIRLDDKDYDIEIELDLPNRRIPKPSRMADDVAPDQTRQILSSPKKKFEIEVFNVILDTAQQQISDRFVLNEPLLKDIAWLDPNKFSIMKGKYAGSLPEDALANLAKLCNIDKFELITQHNQFVLHFEDYLPNILESGSAATGRACIPVRNTASNSIQEMSSSISSVDNETDQNTAAEVTEIIYDDQMEDITDQVEKCDESTKCNKCLVCAMELLHRLNLQGSMYTSLYIAYKFALTLSCTQVSCERVFSILKIIKTRLRSSLGQELLEGFILFYVNRDFKFDYEKALDDLSGSSVELSRYLSL